MKTLVNISLILLMTYSAVGQQQIQEPELPTPETDFIEVFQHQKIDNPIFMEGKLLYVHKIITDHITPEREKKSVENYEYGFDKTSKLINYASDVEFDEMNVEFLNSEIKLTVTNDTLIQQKNSNYLFEGGKLISKTTQTVKEQNFDGITDSVHYSYENDKLSKISFYKKSLLLVLDEDGEEEEYLIPSEYALVRLKEAKYDKNNRLSSVLSIFFIEDEEAIFVDKTLYNFNMRGELSAFKFQNSQYQFSETDIVPFIKGLKENKLKTTPIEFSERSGIFTYDSMDRVIKLETASSENLTEIFEVNFTTTKTIISRSTDSKPDVEYQLTFDENQNPVQEKRFVYIDGEKFLDTETNLIITYQKN